MVKSCLRPNDNYAPQQVRDICLANLMSIKGVEVLTVEKPKNRPRSIHTLYLQQVQGLKRIKSDIVYATENDVLYHPSRFEFKPSTDDFCYQTNYYNLTRHGYLRHQTGRCYSQLVARRESWLNNLLSRLESMANGWRSPWTEPGVKDPPGCEIRNVVSYYAEYPDISIRHGRNYTGERLAKDPAMYIESVPHWGNYKALLCKLGLDTEETAMPSKLNIGSGYMLLDGYVNFDATKVVHNGKETDVVGLASNILDYFKPNSFDEILCCHCLEHMFPKDVKKLLSDCRELLTENGILVIEYPDLLRIIDSWVNKNKTYGDPPSDVKLLDFIFSHNRTFGDYGYHRSGYTEKILTDILVSCGYEVIKDSLRDGMMHGRRYRDGHMEARKI